MKRLGDTETRRRGDEPRNFFASLPSAVTSSQTCPACGSSVARRFAKYCRVCGKFLFEAYQPLDNLRASYRIMGKAIVFEKKMEFEETGNLFEVNKNVRADSAWASFVYSLIPYIGIIFIPVTLLLGISALLAAPKYGGRKLALFSMTLSLVVLTVQILLWWLLYFIPTLGREF